MEYDLVVIGGSQAGIEAASKACFLGARVALVTQSNYHNSTINYFRFREAANLIDRVKYNPGLLTVESNNKLEINFNTVNLINNYFQVEADSLANLAILGVDVIEGEGEFCRLPKQGFIVNKRKLCSLSYLIALNSSIRVEYMSENELLSYYIDDFWQEKNLEFLGNNLAVVGQSAVSIELAQVLGRVGKKVTLVASSSRILPQEELAAAMLIQASLEAEGIDIITNSSVTQVKKIEDEVWLQAGNKALIIDKIIYPEDVDCDFTKLNLLGVRGIEWNRKGIIVNNKLQTGNKNIYACGHSTGIFSYGKIQQQINIILKNILLLSCFSIDYSLFPRVVFTSPTLASIGMIEDEAREHYKNKIYVVREYFKNLTQCKISGQTTGWCQFILNNRGAILGCTIIGDRAEELITTVAVIMHHKIKLSKDPIQALLKTEIITVEPSISVILQKIAISFQKQKSRLPNNKNNWLKTWLKIKRKFNN